MHITRQLFAVVTLLSLNSFDIKANNNAIHHGNHHQSHPAHAHFIDISQISLKPATMPMDGARLGINLHFDNGNMLGASHTRLTSDTMPMTQDMDMTMIHIGRMKILSDKTSVSTMFGALYGEHKQNGRITRSNQVVITIGIRHWLKPKMEIGGNIITRRTEQDGQHDSGVSVWSNYNITPDIAVTYQHRKFKYEHQNQLGLRYYF